MNKKDQEIRYYNCQTRMRYGAGNTIGCGYHSTRQENVEKFINEFLVSRGQALDSLLSTKQDTSHCKVS